MGAYTKAHVTEGVCVLPMVLRASGGMRLRVCVCGFFFLGNVAASIDYIYRPMHTRVHLQLRHSFVELASLEQARRVVIARACVRWLRFDARLVDLNGRLHIP
jgi:hypothetical protein